MEIMQKLIYGNYSAEIISWKLFYGKYFMKTVLLKLIDEN